MENVKEYCLYFGKYVKDEYEERIKNAVAETGVNYDVLKLDSEFDEASKSVSSNGICLYCYFVQALNEEIEDTPDATKIYDKGLGKGIALMNRNLNTYLYQFQNNFKNMEEVIEDTCERIKSSIQWCEKYLSVNY